MFIDARYRGCTGAVPLAFAAPVWLRHPVHFGGDRTAASIRVPDPVAP
jgi:hypothetical protein